MQINDTFHYIDYKSQTEIKAEKLVEQLGVEIAVKVQRFHQSIPGYAETPLCELKNLASALNVGNIFIKDESPRFGLKAFKCLGGSYAMAQLLGAKLKLKEDEITFAKLTTEEAKNTYGDLHFAAVTDGNHGRGVAWFAKQLGYAAKIYMPFGTVPMRVDNIAREGAEVTVYDGNYDEAIAFMKQQVEKHDWLHIQDTAWEGYEAIPLDIMRGYTTMAREALEQLRKAHSVPTHVFLQAGVGSMAAAVTAYMVDYYQKQGWKLPKFIIVEPTVANCLYETAKARDGKRHIVGGAMASMMAGLCCGEPCTLAWDILDSYANGFVEMEDGVDAEGMRRLAKPFGDDPAIVSGESGAAGFSAALALLTRDDLADIRNKLSLDKDAVIFCVSTEGDTDEINYKHIVG